MYISPEMRLQIIIFASKIMWSYPQLVLKVRPKLDQLWKKLCANNNGVFDFGVFEAFMQDSQKVSWCFKYGHF